MVNYGSWPKARKKRKRTRNCDILSLYDVESESDDCFTDDDISIVTDTDTDSLSWYDIESEDDGCFSENDISTDTDTDTPLNTKLNGILVDN